MTSDLVTAWGKRAMASKKLADKAKELAHIAKTRALPTQGCTGVLRRVWGLSFAEIYATATRAERTALKYASCGWGDEDDMIHIDAAGHFALEELCAWMDAKDEWLRQKRDLVQYDAVQPAKPSTAGSSSAEAVASKSTSPAAGQSAEVVTCNKKAQGEVGCRVAGASISAAATPPPAASAATRLPAAAVACTSTQSTPTTIVAADEIEAVTEAPVSVSVSVTVVPAASSQEAPSVATAPATVPDSMVSSPPSKRVKDSQEANLSDSPLACDESLSGEHVSLSLPVLNRSGN